MVDSYLQKVLAETDESVEEVLVLADGTWKLDPLLAAVGTGDPSESGEAHVGCAGGTKSCLIEEDPNEEQPTGPVYSVMPNPRKRLHGGTESNPKARRRKKGKKKKQKASMSKAGVATTADRIAQQLLAASRSSRKTVSAIHQPSFAPRRSSAALRAARIAAASAAGKTMAVDSDASPEVVSDSDSEKKQAGAPESNTVPFEGNGHGRGPDEFGYFAKMTNLTA